MRIDEVRTYADMAEYFRGQAESLRGHANWHRNGRHYAKAVEIEYKASEYEQLYAKMLEISAGVDQNPNAIAEPEGSMKKGEEG